MSYCGHGPLVPQQIEPQRSPPIGPGASQLSPVPHAGSVPHLHTPLSQRSPIAQHSAPHAGPDPCGQPPVAPQNPGSASAHACFVHDAPVAVHVHELQPSPAGKTSPSKYS